MELAKVDTKATSQLQLKENKPFFSAKNKADSYTLPIQPKLALRRPNDVYEQQADSVAEQVMKASEVQTNITPVSPQNIQRDKNGPREEEQNPVTDGLSTVASNLSDNNPQFAPFVDGLKTRFWSQQPAELRYSIIGFGIADALMVGSVFALDPGFRGTAIRALDGVNLMTPIRLIPHSDLFTPSSFTYHLPDAAHPGYEFNGEFDLTPYFDLLHDHASGIPRISPRFGLNLNYDPATHSLNVVGGTFNLDLFNHAITIGAGVNQFYAPGPQMFTTSNPTDSPVWLMQSLPSQQIRDTRFNLTIDVPRLINVIRGVPETPVQRKCATCEREEEVSRKETRGDEITNMDAVEQTLQTPGQTLRDEIKTDMEDGFGYDFSNVKIHDDNLAHKSSADINAYAYTYQNHIAFAQGQYQPETDSGKKLLAHELTHVVQQQSARPALQRKQKGISNRAADTFFKGQNETAEVAPASTTTAPLLNDQQVKSAIAYMRNTYAPQSVSLLRTRFELADGNQVDRDLVLAVAQYQDTNHLTVDGKLGETSFNTIQAEGGEVMQDVVMFRVMSPLNGGMEQSTGTGGTVDMEGHFTVEIHLPPGEDCGKYEYRQFICARVEMLPAGADPAGPLTDLKSLFSVPGGLRAIPNYTEDGNTALNARYGHRSRPGLDNNHYLNNEGHVDQANGCIFKSWDFPGITGRVTNPGEQYEFDFRFRGEVVHRDRGTIATKFWSVKGDFVF
jgi:hypothetical protein